MPERRFLEYGNAAIQIEVTTAGAAGGTAVGPKLVRALQEMAKLIGDGIEEIERGPNRVEVRFGLGLSADGNFLLTQGGDGANFEVQMQWDGGPSALAPPLPPQE